MNIVGENQQKFGILFEIIDVERQGFLAGMMALYREYQSPFLKLLLAKVYGLNCPSRPRFFLLAMLLQRHYTLIHGRRCPFYEMYYAKLQLCKRWSKIQVINKLKILTVNNDKLRDLLEKHL